jgi:hypothetical protein
MRIPPYLNYTLFSRNKCFNFSKNKGVFIHRRENEIMPKQDPSKSFTFEFNEHGANEVSQQILDSYNSGFIGQDFEVTNENAAQSTAE